MAEMAEMAEMGKRGDADLAEAEEVEERGEVGHVVDADVAAPVLATQLRSSDLAAGKHQESTVKSIRKLIGWRRNIEATFGVPIFFGTF